MNTQPSPRVSIIIPVFNGERFLAASLESVQQQTYRDYEVIVVDDGSTDGTKAIVLAAGAPVRYVHQPNRGPAAARNTGIQAARGELFCFLDADDAWVPNKLAIQLEFMDRHPHIGMIFSDEEEFDERGVQCRSLLATSAFFSALTQHAPIDGAFQKLLEENFIPTSMVMARKSCFESAGVFDVALRGPEDRDMWSRIAAQHSIAFVPPVLGRKRIVASSVSRDVEMTLRSRIIMWTKAGRVFPELAPRRTVNALLEPTYVQLGFLLLEKGRSREARAVALQCFTVARRPHAWLMAGSLFMLTCIGKSGSAFVFEAKRRLVGSRWSSANS